MDDTRYRIENVRSAYKLGKRMSSRRKVDHANNFLVSSNSIRFGMIFYNYHSYPELEDSFTIYAPN